MNEENTTNIESATELYNALKEKPDSIILKKNLTEKTQSGRLSPISNIGDILTNAGYIPLASQLDKPDQITYIRYEQTSNSQ